MKYIDLTHTIRHGMPVFPGEKEPSVLRDILPEEVAYVTHRLESNMHTGTHIDAPFHAKSGTISIDNYPVEMFAGPAAVIDVSGKNVIAMQPEWAQIFDEFKIVLFHTGYSRNWGSEQYYTDYPVFENSVAEALAKANVRIAGFDSPSPDKAPFAFHSVYLKEGRFLVENLNNLGALLGHKQVDFMAFPLKIEAEASLIRAVAVIAA